jgi:hypothetical protein
LTLNILAAARQSYVAMISAVVIAASPSICRADGVDLFQPLSKTESVAPSPSAASSLDSLRRDKSLKSVTAVRVQTSAISSSVINVKLGTKTLKFVKKHLEQPSSDSFSWAGTGGFAEYAFFAVTNGVFFGQIHTQTAVYEVRTLDDGQQVLVELDMTGANEAVDKIQSPETLPSPPSASPSSSAPAQSGAADAAVDAFVAPAAQVPVPVRILVAYTPRAASALGNNLNSQIASAINQLNLAVSGSDNTGASFQAVLATTLQVNYSGATDATSALTAFEAMSDVKDAHDSSSADLMVMLDTLANNADAGASAGINVTAPNAYAVVSTTYMTSIYTFAHEVGHLMGLDHAVGDTSQNVFRYGHGFWMWSRDPDSVNPQYWGICAHTVMSWATTANGRSANLGCESDPRLLEFSNTWDNWKGLPVGDINTANNAAVLRITAPVVTNFHNTKLGSGGHVPPPGNPCSKIPRPPGCA